MSMQGLIHPVLSRCNLHWRVQAQPHITAIRSLDIIIMLFSFFTGVGKDENPVDFAISHSMGSIS